MIIFILNKYFFKLRSRAVFLFIVLLAPAAATAQSSCMLVPVALSQRVQAAPLVVEARVASQQAELLRGRRSIVTRSQLEVFKVFKGHLPAGPLSVLTPGGTLGQVREEVTGAAELTPGAQGIFLLEADPAAPGELRPYAGPQGFVEYDSRGQAASDPFAHYASITGALYGALATATGAPYRELLPNARLEAAAQRPSPRSATAALLGAQAPAISSFSPASVTAGTGTKGAILTISGTGFGDAQGAGYVQFRNADRPGTDASPVYTQPLASDYLSWSDTQVIVRVPSKSQSRNAAGTGAFQVATDAGTLATSPSALTVTYALGNITYTNTTAQNYRPYLSDADGNGGYTLQYSPSFPAAAQAPFERGLASWHCATSMNRTMSPTATTTDVADMDGVNVVRFDQGTELPTGVLGLTKSYYAGCGSSSAITNWVLMETDYTFDSGTAWNYAPTDPTTSQYDFQSVALHELGHGQQLAHIISATGVMNYALGNGQTRRGLDSSTDVAAATDVITFSTNATPDALCGASAFTTSAGGCPQPLPVELTAFTVRHQPGQGTQLNWTTASEQQSAAFIVESQEDATGPWLAVARVAAAGNSRTQRQYAALDARPLAGGRYYRLHQLDLDGTSSYSPVRVVHAAATEVVAYPNPAAAGLVHLSGPLAEGTLAQVRLLDATGRCQARAACPAGQAAFDLPLAGVPAGLYVVEWDGGAGLCRTRLEVQ